MCAVLALTRFGRWLIQHSTLQAAKRRDVEPPSSPLRLVAIFFGDNLWLNLNTDYDRKECLWSDPNMKQTI